MLTNYPKCTQEKLEMALESSQVWELQAGVVNHCTTQSPHFWAPKGIFSMSSEQPEAKGIPLEI